MDVDPIKVIFNPAVPYEVPHMILAAYWSQVFSLPRCTRWGCCAGGGTATIAWAADPLTVAAIATPIQFAVGDTAARAIADDQPIKFAAMECVQETHSDVTEYIYGRCTSEGVKGGIGIPGFDSFLVGWSTDTWSPGWTPFRPRPAAGKHDAALGVRHDGRDLLGADPAWAVARMELVAPA